MARILALFGTPRRIITWVLVGLLLVNLEKLAEQEGWDMILARYWRDIWGVVTPGGEAMPSVPVINIVPTWEWFMVVASLGGLATILALALIRPIQGFAGSLSAKTRIGLRELGAMSDPGLSLEPNEEDLPELTHRNVVTHDGGKNHRLTTWLRWVARATEKDLLECNAYLERVHKWDLDSESWIDTGFADRIQLAWSHHGARPRDIPKGERAFFDVVLSDPLVGYPRIGKPHIPTRTVGLFELPGRYRMKVRVRADGDAVSRNLEFLWSGNWEMIEWVRP